MMTAVGLVKAGLGITILPASAKEIEAEPTVVELAETFDDGGPIAVEVPRPLLECQEIAVPVVLQLDQLEWRLGELVEEIVQHKKRVVPAVDVLHHIGR